MQSSFDLQYIIELMPILFKYLGVTMEMALWGFLFALILSLSLALIRVFKMPFIQHLAALFISFFRGTPLLVQLFLLYYGLPQFMPIFIGMDAFTASIIGLSLHFSAYMAESIRARNFRH
ncbi:ABC transporter permease subunit [Psychromonas sp. KJ10-10]|uniref:ABC transporter permease subunit n=1 Tax=Psychromonas sp. KJ10-10 TaxID=3391823 RepID=UPI0039B3E664